MTLKQILAPALGRGKVSAIYLPVVTALSGSSMTVAELARRCHVSEKRVRAAIGTARRVGLPIRRVDKCTFRLDG